MKGKIKHGHARKNSVSTTYTTWTRIKDRCYNPKKHHYDRYGGRGIKVCERWLNSFENFLLDMGERPDNNYSIERINSDLDYTPTNCKWATKEEQANNTRTNKFIEWNGEIKTIAQWGRFLNIPASVISKRLIRGWNIESTLTIEHKTRKKHKKQLSEVEKLLSGTI